jgi:hypothetical protein
MVDVSESQTDDLCIFDRVSRYNEQVITIMWKQENGRKIFALSTLDRFGSALELSVIFSMSLAVVFQSEWAATHSQ